MFTPASANVPHTLASAPGPFSRKIESCFSLLTMLTPRFGPRSGRTPPDASAWRGRACGPRIRGPEDDPTRAATLSQKIPSPSSGLIARAGRAPPPPPPASGGRGPADPEDSGTLPNPAPGARQGSPAAGAG